MVRKVKLNATQVRFAKENNIPLEDYAKAKLPKRGRPVGSKNKPKTFEQELADWDKAEAELIKRINWEGIAREQEAKLKAYIAENDELARICVMRWEEIQHLKYLVKYLEGRHEDSSV